MTVLKKESQSCAKVQTVGDLSFLKNEKASYRVVLAPPSFNSARGSCGGVNGEINIGNDDGLFTIRVCNYKHGGFLFRRSTRKDM